MTARAHLERELGGPIAALDLLSEQEIDELAATVDAALRTETATLADSVDAVIGALPWPLRTAAKKIMFGNRLG
ncbi:hypothetical protein [Nocardia bhagyanarayanae]|uniref:Uncharacterized protein n=1 Tax=Nocardia bhagyanarayanae TaxID=1215925 RepID=A0A543FGU5_9NOCA|nr:hypothetical protein [Nocardia bhagyanarayanae]TQM33011.1 hypothetical protein FB390_4724 [Nocardia bhagyanarayanae]